LHQDREEADFKKTSVYKNQDMGCIFCEMSKNQMILQNEFVYAIYDKFPVTPLHTLVIPKRHVGTYFELSQFEICACHLLLQKAKHLIEEEDPLVTGFNIGINNGATAGQTIFHCHVHLIPRREGDVKNPRGGIRHVIPHKGFY
jgi:ATP adenylyltransferase